MKSGKILAVAALAAALAWPMAGQEKAAPKAAGAAKQMAAENEASITATVEAIDTAKRELTLKGPKGNVVVMEVPESVTRFPEIKVGDHLSVRYKESLVLEVKKADAAAKLGMTTDAGLQRTEGKKPGGVITRTITATVEVVAVDPAAPSITVRTADGNTYSRRVRDVKNLEGVHAGDKIVIKYSEAVAMQVSAPPAK